jgi:hypothetical protein
LRDLVNSKDPWVRDAAELASNPKDDRFD